MSRPFAISLLLSAASSLAIGAAAPPAELPQAVPQPSIQLDTSQPPTDAQREADAQKLLANQHNNDVALEQYERIERHIDRSGGPNPRTLEDKVYRAVPIGTGTMRILLKDEGRSTDATEYRRQLQSLESMLEAMSRPGDSRYKTASEKYAKRQRERAEFVDAMHEAFVVKWAGRETVNGVFCDVYQLDPNPTFHPHGIFQDALQHATARVWIDHQNIELVRGEAHVLSDISFGGGILGKLNKGGTVSMDQAEVASGIWEPTRVQYDFTGRKFLFSFEEHQVVESSHYRHIGPPKEALASVQNELATGKTFSEDP